MELLQSVEAVYQHVLDDKHRAFLEKFRRLTKDEQCLYIRLANRKGDIFHRSVLAYAEIDSQADHGLLTHGFIRKAEEGDYRGVLETMTKERLYDIARQSQLSTVRATWSKSQLVDHISEKLPYQRFVQADEANEYLVQLESETVDFLVYLYFGKAHDDLKSFTLRDLHIVRTNGDSALKSRFADAMEAKSCFYYSDLLKRLKSGGPAIFERMAGELPTIEDCPSEYARRLKAQAILRVGQYFEKQKAFGAAISLYRLSNSHECNERMVRLEYRHGDPEYAKALLERMIEDPASDDEYTFATDFYTRKFNSKKRGDCMDLLLTAETITIDDIHRNSPERGAASYFRRSGWRAYSTENDFWQSVFGLLFWTELFATGEALHSEFDQVPHCLKDNTFSTKFKEAIDDKLSAIRCGKGLLRILQTVSTAWGKPNGIFNWYTVDIEALREFFTCGNPNSIAEMIALMCKDYYQVRDGFPDLMLVKDESLQFVEIKAEGDLVRRNQLTRLRQLGEAGFKADIVRINYRYDPEQTYVVVDIETTGGRATSERVTELGAVKIKNHKVIAEWHSLINPQRRIPQSITALTGITNEMVRDAPVFLEVADSFLEFMGDAVFVAHNVNFDYGFLAEEYQRIERAFRYPKFCTVSGMRRYYPGQACYKLGYLCERYGIPLERHHRALHDAKAASCLLAMINTRREERVDMAVNSDVTISA
jgi:DNA polymerase III subunit epsilon